MFISAVIVLFSASFLYEGSAIYVRKIINMENEAKILFVGDMNFDRYIRQVGSNKGEDFIFSCQSESGLSLGDFLKSFDLVVGNLEGPITDNPSVSMGSVIESPENYIFTFPTSTANLLAKNNIKLVNLGNNHIGNFGEGGIFSTKKYLDKARVKYFGGADIDDNIYRTEIAGNKISFVSFNEFGGENAEKISQKISEEKNSGQIVFVYTHWGDEYVPPPERVKRLARSFIYAGAEMIIGSHPHIVQESETLRLRSGQEGKIYYSLGNFIFDQYWNKEVSTGLVLEVDIKGEKINVIEHKAILNRDGRTCLMK